MTRRNLAVLAAERGGHAEAEKLWKEVLAECPATMRRRRSWNINLQREGDTRVAKTFSYSGTR